MKEDIKHINIVASITGYHNPIKHKDMYVEDFLWIYLRRQAQMCRNRNDEYRKKIIVEVLYNWEYWVDYVKKYFSKTFKT